MRTSNFSGEALTVQEHILSVDSATLDLQAAWIIDSGASSHMTGDREHLQDLQEVPERCLTLPDGGSFAVTQQDQLYSHIQQEYVSKISYSSQD